MNWKHLLESASESINDDLRLPIPTVSLDVISFVANSWGYYRGHIEPHAAQ